MRTGLARRGAAGRPLAAVACAVLCASLKTERALFFELLQMDAAIEPARGVTACGEQLQTFQELSAEQVAIIQLQRTVCADYYGPYTGAKDEQFMLYNFCRVNSSENGRSQVLLRRWRRMRFRYSTTWSKLKGRLAPTLPLRTPGWCRRAFKKSTRTKRPQ